MLPFETFEDPGSGSPTLRQLPLYVEPKEDEVLLSWLLRLATRLGVSLQTLVRAAFWIDDRREQSQWWRRPEPQMLWRVSDKSGVSIERLRRMTFESWSPVYRDDEAGDRLSAERFRAQPSRRPVFRYGLCEQCLEAEATLHLRTLWAIGWVAVCPKHASIMTARCQRCSSKLQIGSDSSVASFAPATCLECGSDLRYGLPAPAHPSVIRFQHTLLEGKRQGMTELTGLGRLSWMEVVALADVVLGMFWTETRPAQQQQAYLLFQKEYELSETRFLSTRYCDLALFCWLTEGGRMGQVRRSPWTGWPVG